MYILKKCPLSLSVPVVLVTHSPVGRSQLVVLLSSSQHALCQPPNELRVCVRECVCVCERVCKCECVSVYVCVCEW